MPVMAATPTMARFLGFFTIRPAMYTPMVTVRNFSSSPKPPNWPSMISLNTSSPVAAPRAADKRVKQHGQGQRDEQEKLHGEFHNTQPESWESVR